MWHAKTFATDQTRAEDSKALRYLRRGTESRLAQRRKSARTKNRRDLLRAMVFACGFIVTVYARFSIESLARAAKIVIRLF